MNIVSLNRVEKHYQGVHALKGLNLELQQGKILGLFGHNGAGKTTTIKLILGLIKATSGEVRIFNKDPTSFRSRELRQQIGFLQENVSFYDQLSGFEVLHYFARLKKSDKKQCHQLLDQVGLSHAAKRRVKTYSKGMRQRLGLAQALLGEPKLLLLDEPTVGLDPIATQDFYKRIDQLKQQGCTIILCSHVLPGVEKYIDSALIMGQGRLLAEGNLDDLRQKAELPVRLQLQGDIALPDNLAENAYWNEQGLTLKVALKEKMAVLRQVLSLPNLTNVDQYLPTLEDLYSHFSASNPAPGENS